MSRSPAVGLFAALRMLVAVVALGLGVAASAAADEKPLSLLLLPPIGGEGSPQLAISWKGEQAGQLELSVVDAAGRSRALKTRALEPGMHLDGVQLSDGETTLVAVLRDAAGRELARAETAARAGLGPLTEGPGGATESAPETVKARPAPQPKGGTLDWKATFTGNDGPNGVVTAMTVYDDGTGPALIIGGNFTTAGGQVVNRIARWNGRSWSALGAGLDSQVNALTVFNGDLVAGGFFSGGVRRWNGAAWSVFGGGLFSVRALTVFRGELIAGGGFTGGASRWTGSSWSTLGGGLFSFSFVNVNAFAEFNGDLIVGGEFATAGAPLSSGGLLVSNIARWNGSAWFQLGTGAPNPVFALSVYRGELIVGGDFISAGGVNGLNRIARWNGSVWSALGSGMNSRVLALTVHNGELIAGGFFTTAGGTAASYIAHWNGSTWSALGSGIDNVPFALTVHNGELIAGGQFRTAGGASANFVARWNGSAWSALGSGNDNGVNSAVYALAVLGSELYVAGEFTNAGGELANRIARWNGSAWSALGSGGGNGLNGAVYALAVLGGDLYAGGFFTQANVGGTVVTANNIARWNGSAWSALGSGGGNGLNSSGVRTLAVLGGDLYAGGFFTQANVGGTVVTASNIARWNGSAWSGLGSGGGNGVDNGISALAVLGGDLYAGGFFTQANVGGTEVAANRIARWNGSAWSALGSGMNSSVNALTVYGGELIAGGGFNTAGGTSANFIARWNGSAWSALGAGMNSSVSALTVVGGELIAGGGFTTAGGTSANRIARWNGSAWSALGSGMNSLVFALTVYGGELMAGGLFGSAGSVVSPNIAAYGVADLTVTEITGTHPTPSRAGEPVRIRARVVASIAPTVGHITITGAPGGSCSDLTLTPVNDTTSEAECTIRWNTAGVRTLTATYIGGVSGTTALQPSTSAPFVHTVNAATEDWRPMFVDVETGIDGNTFLPPRVWSSVIWDDGSGPALVVAGAFTHFGTATANRVAKWNGTRWIPLGTGMNFDVRALAVYGGRLIAAGDFSTAGGVSANRIARWNGATWDPLGSGISGSVQVLAVYNGELIAGGLFNNAGGSAVANIARWSDATNSWSGLGSGVNSNVNTLAVFNGNLIAGGSFGTAGGVTANRIASWNGVSWAPVGSGTTGSVDALAVYDGRLIVGGSFTSIGGISANNIASWSGASWATLGSGVTGIVSALTIHDGGLVAGGTFGAAGGSTVRFIARWNGSLWSPVGSGGGAGLQNGSGLSVVRTLTSFGSDLFVGGDFRQANIGGNVVATENIARWNGSNWASLGGSNIDASVIALTVYRGDLVIGGFFTQVGGIPASRIARWNGSQWFPLGSGTSDAVYALREFNGELVAGGAFASAGGVANTSRIARWNGTSWAALGTGANDNVNALEVHDGQLIAGGLFTSIGGVANTNRIGRWNGSGWSALGTGVNADVQALTVYNGSLIVGGGFTSASGISGTSRLARWNGTAWSALGTGGNDGLVLALGTHEGALIAGGSFSQMSSVVNTARIARWNGISWSALGIGMNDTVWALAVNRGQLIAAGSFTTAGGVAATRLARWNGSAWAAMGSGTDNAVRPLLDVQGELIIGGDFNNSFGRRTPFLTVLGPTTATTTTVHATSPNPSLPGQPVTVTARVSGRVAPNPGTVTFIGAPSGSCTDLTLTVLNDTTSEASCTITFNVAGTQQITARYDGAALPGDFGHLPSVSGSFAHVVAGAAQSTTTAIASITPAPSAVGGAVTINATVTGASTRPVDGQVTVSASTGESCVDNTPSDGGGAVSTFSCAITFATAGPRTLTASFAGSSAHTGSASSPSAHTVNPATTTTTIVSVTPPGSQTVGVPYAVRVLVAGGAAPSGTVTVNDGDGNTCAIALPGGTQCTLQSSSEGAKTLTASYSGNANHSASSGTQPYTITASPGNDAGLQVGAVVLPATAASPTVNPTVSVTFPQPFDAIPVVIVQPSDGDSDPQAVRIRNVSATGFELLQVEAPGCAGCTGAASSMTVHWLAAMPGSYRLPLDGLMPAWIEGAIRGGASGALLKVGAVSTQATQYNPSAPGFGGWPAPGWESISWPALGDGLDFTAPPMVLATVQSWANEGANLSGSGLVGTSQPWATVAVRNVTSSGLQVALDAGEVSADDTAPPGFGVPETIGYVAIESNVSQLIEPLGGGSPVGMATSFATAGVPCTVSDLLFPPATPITPASFRAFGAMQTRSLPDGGWLRRCWLSNPAGTTVRVGMRRDADRAFDGAAQPFGGPVLDDSGLATLSGDLTTTPVTIAEMSAQRTAEGLDLRWSTAGERAQLGFRVWGRNGPREDWRLLSLIVPSPSPEALAPRSYRHVVPAAEAAGVVEVRLEDVDLTGAGRRHPSIAVGEQRGEPAVVPPIDWAAIRAENAAAQAQVVPARSSGAPVVLAMVRKDGVQRVPVAALLAQDARFAGMPASALALLDDGRPLPRHVDCAVLAEGCTIEFYGLARPSRYGPENAYTLTLSPLQALAAVSGRAAAGSAALQVFEDRLVARPNREYSYSVPDGDPWYDEWLSTSGAPAQLTRTFSLPERQPGPLRLTVHLWGGLEFPGSLPDHHVELWVNDQRVAERWFDGLRSEVIEVEVPAALLTTTNTLTLRLPRDTGYSMDAIGFEGFEVRWPRASRMTADRLANGAIDPTLLDGAGDALYASGFEAGAGGAAAGFGIAAVPAGSVLWSVADGRLGRDVLAAGEVVVDGAVEAWHVAAPTAIATPSLELPAAPYSLPTTLDYLVVAHPIFADGLAPILALQQSRGLATAVVRTDTIFARHSDHARDPVAIQRTIAEARQLGARHVLLVGGDTLDYHDYFGVGSISHVPTHYRRLDLLIADAASDFPYADVDGDGLPDVAVGRLPVRTQAELGHAVASITQRGGSIGNRHLGVAGRSQPHERFGPHTRAMLSYLRQPGQTRSFALADEIGTVAARAAAREGLAGTADWVSYLGHSSWNRWAFDNLLDASSLGSITRIGLPAVVAQWSCQTNDFVWPTSNTMAHALMLRPNRLAAAVIGSTSLVEDASHLALATRFYDLVEDGRLGDQPGPATRTIGEALLRAQRDLLSREPAHRPAVEALVLFGDPAMEVVE